MKSLRCCRLIRNFRPFSGARLKAAQRVRNLLAAAMNLPKRERRTDPLLNTDVLPEDRPSNVISAPQTESIN